MTALDTNILVAALVYDHSLHQEVTQGLENLLDTKAITNVTVGETLRLLTHKRLFAKPPSFGQAVKKLNEFIQANRVEVLQPPIDWWDQAAAYAKTEIADLSGNDVFDIQIAITLRQNGVQRIWTKDSDFKKYDFLKTVSFFSE